MNNYLLILIGRIISGVIAFCYLIFLKKYLPSNDYLIFSTTMVSLVFLSSFNSIILNAILIRNSLSFNNVESKPIIFYYTIFFILIGLIAIEISISMNFLHSNFRFLYYTIISLNVVASSVNSNYQINTQFKYFLGLDFLKNTIPFFILLIINGKYILNSGRALIISNIVGVVFLGIYLKFCFDNYLSFSFRKFLQYIKMHFIDDISYAISFISFNAVANYFIAFDRINITRFNVPIDVKSKITYTSDQVSKIFNTILFPINTKISGELGLIYKEGKYIDFIKKVNRSFLATLVVGFVLLSSIVIFLSVFSSIVLKFDISESSLIQYSIANTLYLSCLVYQKKYDYSKFSKFLPAILISTSFLLSFFIRETLNENHISIFMSVTILYFILLILSSYFRNINFQNVRLDKIKINS